MASSTEWEKLSKDFKELHALEGDMRAELAPLDREDDGELWKRQWKLKGYKENGEGSFYPLAEDAAKYSGLNLSGQEACDWWCNELKIWLQNQEEKSLHIDKVTVAPEVSGRGLQKLSDKSLHLHVLPTTAMSIKRQEDWLNNLGFSLPEDAVKTIEYPSIPKVCHQSGRFCRQLATGQWELQSSKESEEPTPTH